MNKTALALTIMSGLIIPLAAEAHLVGLVEANFKPNWGWVTSQPSISVISPVEGGYYSSNDVWLNFTVTKPPDWANTTKHITYVSYCVDGTADGPFAHSGDKSDANEVSVYVQDYAYAGVGDASSSLSFSFNLAEKSSNPWLSNSSTELEGGLHAVDVCVCWTISGMNDWTFSGVDNTNGLNGTIPFYVYTPTPSPQPTSTPTPTHTPDPTATPTPTPIPEAESQPATLPATLMVVASIGITLGVIGLLVYHKKRNTE